MMTNMIRKLPVFVAVTAFSLTHSAFAAQERWRVSEGLAGEPHGVWTVDQKGEELTAYAEMFDANGEKKTYFLSGKHEKGEIVFNRQSVDSASKCTYKISGYPQETGESLSGVIDCDGANQSWMAKKMPEPIEAQVQEQSLPNLPFPRKR